jgi:CheY-like chemotaxis protein
VNAVTAHAASFLQQMLGRDIEVTLALGHDIKRIKIRESHLEEIVLNLGIHARDAMPNGGHLTVATTMHTNGERGAAGGAPSEYVRMVVADTGGGMSADAQSRLFEPFFASDDGGVSAMGLAKVDAIVKLAGGRIHVESAETRLAMPVLVVEDDPHVRELIRLVLVRAGHEAVSVDGPRAALAALNHQPATSLMLVDVVMPEMDGYDLVAEARKIAPGVHVVFISGFARDKARHPSGDGFLAKPFTVEALTGIVEEALNAV